MEMANNCMKKIANNISNQVNANNILSFYHFILTVLLNLKFDATKSC